MHFNYEEFNRGINMHLSEDELLIIRFALKDKIESFNMIDGKYKQTSIYLLNKYKKLLKKVESVLKFINR